MTATFALSSAAVEPPDAVLTVSAPFRSTAVKHYGAGEDTLNSPPFRLTTRAAMTALYGGYGAPHAQSSYSGGWVVKVYATLSERVAAACAAPDRAERELYRGADLLEPVEPPQMIARVRRRDYHWGRAVSFLSQTTQDAALFVPHNGHLEYEVWGATRDRKYTVLARMSVAHPRLAVWGPDVRDARSLAALNRDRDYRLVSKCSAEEFQPPLSAFDRLLNTLVIR